MVLSYDVPERNEPRLLRPRFIGAMVIVSVAFFTLLARLYSLQVLRGEELASRGEQNFVQEVVVAHDRGIIYDRYGRIIVDNRPSLDLQITPAFLGPRKDAEATLERLHLLLGSSAAERERVDRQVLRARAQERFLPIAIYRDLDPDQVDAIEAYRSMLLLDGVDIVEARRRTYRYGSTAAHLLGYVNEIDPLTLEAERKQDNPRRYKLGDAIGRSGIEQTFEEHLRGVDGHEKVVVDAKGRRRGNEYFQKLLGESRRLEPRPGHNLYLTIDLDLQQRAEAAFHGMAGAVIAMDPNSGAVLAYVSLPSYDPNLVSGVLAKDEKRRLDTDPLKPWLNRPIQGGYAPGSTFKIVTALAALAAHATSTSEHVNCPGYLSMGSHVWRCHKDSGHGLVDLRAALMVSCDTYFYAMGARLGINPIAEMGRTLGFGHKTGIDLPGEKTGIMPDEDFHNRVEAKTGGYQRGMAINTSIGQGAVVVTPLQQAVAYVAVANGGKVLRPHVVERVESADFRRVRRSLPSLTKEGISSARDGWFEGAPLSKEGMESVEALRSLVHEDVSGQPPVVLYKAEAEVLRTLGLPEEDLLAVEEGLIAVANDPRGTAYWRRSKITSMAAKTGTAQVVRIGKLRLKAKDMDYFHRDHAWFVAYAPAEKPELVVAVLNEHSGHGSSEAGPIAVATIDAYFELQRARTAPSVASAKETP